MQEVEDRQSALALEDYATVNIYVFDIGKLYNTNKNWRRRVITGSSAEVPGAIESEPFFQKNCSDCKEELNYCRHKVRIAYHRKRN